MSDSDHDSDAELEILRAAMIDALPAVPGAQPAAPQAQPAAPAPALPKGKCTASDSDLERRFAALRGSDSPVIQEVVISKPKAKKQARMEMPKKQTLMKT